MWGTDEEITQNSVPTARALDPAAIELVQPAVNSNSGQFWVVTSDVVTSLPLEHAQFCNKRRRSGNKLGENGCVRCSQWALTKMEEEKEYLKLNPRGRKFGKSTKRRSLDKLGQDYADVGLPAHKAALLGDVEALKVVFFGDETANGVLLRDLYLSTPLHLAARCNQDQAAKWVFYLWIGLCG